MNKTSLLIGGGVGLAAVAGLVFASRANASETGAVPVTTQPTTGGNTAPTTTPTTQEKPPATVSGNVPRGIRNNNPGNIKKSASAWVGKVGNDGTFEIFDTAQNGIRAMARLLRTYRNSYGLNTIRGIVARWTSGDSGTIQDNYVKHIVNRSGIQEHLQLIGISQYAAVVEAMIEFENARQQPYSKSMIVQAVQDGMA